MFTTTKFLFENSQITVKFKEIDKNLALKLLDFVSPKNLNKSITIDGVEYIFDFMSKNSSQFWKSRGLSVYFKTNKSIIRISDHWAKSNYNEKSRKLNCGSIGGKTWIIDNKTDEKIIFFKYAGKYPWAMLAGKAGLSKLNKSADHWSS